MVMRLLASSQIQKIQQPRFYLILASISLILFFYSMGQIKPVVVELDDFLGLASCLTLVYWLGLALIVACSILAYLDKQLKNTAVFIFVLLVLGLFLFGITQFAAANPSDSSSYYPAGEVKTLLATHHIDITSPYPLMAYRSWPGFHFLSASILSVTGIEFTPMAKYMPLFFTILFILVTFSIGRRLRLSLNQSFLLSFLALSSGWVVSTYHGPFSLGLAAFFLLFLFAVQPSNTSAWKVCSLLTFALLVVTHGLTAVAMLFALMVLAVYNRKPGYWLLCSAIFFSWYLYLAPWVFEIGVGRFWAEFTSLDLAYLTGYRHGPEISQMVEINRLMRLSYLAIHAIMMIISIALLLMGRVKKENRRLIGLCFSWIIGVALLLPVGYGYEMSMRLYQFGLIPVIAIIILSLSNRKIFITLMILFVMLFVPVRYGTEYVGQTLDSELSGAAFFAQRVNPQSPYMYGPGGYYIPFYNPSLIELKKVHYDLTSVEPPAEQLRRFLPEVDFLIDSQITHNAAMFHYECDPLRDWLLEEGNRFQKLYDNGSFTIYRR